MITMSDSTFGHYGTSGHMPQQLEFKDCVWESTKGPSTTSRAWLCIFGGIVGNYNVGAATGKVSRPVPQTRSPNRALLRGPRFWMIRGCLLERNLRARAFMVHGPLVTSHRFRRVNVLVLRVIHWHWGVKLVLQLHRVTTTSTALGVGFRLSHKTRRKGLYRQTLPCRKGLPLRWPRRQLKYQGCR